MTTPLAFGSWHWAPARIGVLAYLTNETLLLAPGSWILLLACVRACTGQGGPPQWGLFDNANTTDCAWSRCGQSASLGEGGRGSGSNAIPLFMHTS